MSWRLKISVRVIVGVALSVALAAAVLALFPTVAEAQSTSSSRGSSLVVVRPGDSLWSISSERLGPNASPQQIANGVEQIYTLNQNRIGGDPNLIFAGQKLLLPAVDERSRAEASRAASPTPEATQPAESSPAARASKSETERASSTEVGEAERKAGKTSDPVAQPVALPNMPPTQKVTPKVGSPSETDDPSQTPSQTADPSPVESFGRTAHSLLSSATSAIVGLFPQDDQFAGRRLVGLAIIVLTLLVAGLIAWKLPLKRNLGGAEVWGIPTGIPTGYTGHYARYDAHPSEVPDRYENTPGGAPMSRFGGEAPAVKNGRNGAEMIAAIMQSRKRSLREWAHGSRRLPRRVVATGAHNPRVSRHLRDAGSPRMRPRPSSAKRGRRL